MFEELAFWVAEVEFFSRPFVEFFLGCHDEFVREVIEVGLFRDVSSDEFVGVFYGAFLPGAVGVCEIDDDVLRAFGRELFGDEPVCRELASVVGGDALDLRPVWVEQPDHCHGGFPCLLAVFEPLHDDEVSGAFRQGENGMSVGIQDGVHLPVSEPLAVRLLGALVYAGAVGDVCGLGGLQLPHPPRVLEAVRHPFGQPPRGVRVHVVVDGLLADAHAPLAQHPGNLCR